VLGIKLITGSGPTACMQHNHKPNHRLLLLSINMAVTYHHQPLTLPNYSA